MAKRKPKESLLMTLREAATRTGVPYNSLRELVLEGHLPCVKLGSGRRVWLKRSDFDRLIERSTRRAPKPLVRRRRPGVSREAENSAS